MYEKNIRVKEIMKALDLTQSVLSEKLGIDQSEISRILTCKKQIGDSVCYALICKLYINPLWLEDGEGDMFLCENGVKSQHSDNNSERIRELKYTIEVQKDLIDELKNKKMVSVAPRECDAGCAAAV